MKLTLAFILGVASAVDFFETVSVQRDGSALTRDWSISCGATSKQTTATLTVKVETQSSYTTFSVDITGKFETTAISSSEETFGDRQVTTGQGKLFTDLMVGETHELPVSYTYTTTGSRSIELTAKITTGDWSWPDGESFTETITVLIENDGCTAPYTGQSMDPAGSIDPAGSASPAISMTLPLVALGGSLAALLSL